MKQVILIRTPHLPDVKFRMEWDNDARKRAERLAWLHACQIEREGTLLLVQASDFYAKGFVVQP